MPRRTAWPVSLITLFFSSALFAADPPTGSSTSDAASLAAANRLFEEELKLAARAQIYLVLNLAEGSITVKGRGLELQRIPIAGWSTAASLPATPSFKLRARPPVTRPRAATVEHGPVSAIELQNMPDTYTLQFDPGLLIVVTPSWRDRPWEWLKAMLQEWWWGVRMTVEAAGQSDSVLLHLILTQEAAQLLAWTAVDGMPLLLTPATSP